MCGNKMELSLGAEEGRIPLVVRDEPQGGDACRGTPAERDDRYRRLVEELPVLILEMLPDGAISYVNAAASDFFGFSMTRCGELPEPTFCACHLEAICGLLPSLTREEPLTSLTSRVDFGGTTHWIEWSLRGRFDDNDTVQRFLVAGFDITEKKCREERLLESREVALAANKAKSEFLTNMSHEIRTPLNGVLGMMQLLQESDLSSEQRDFADIAVQSCARLASLLSDILDLSRAEASKMPLAPRPFSLNGLVADVHSLFGPAARQNGVRLTCSVDEAVPDVLLGDRLRIQQVLNNLVGNALKFTRSGEVRIEAFRQLPADHERFRVLFMVSDTGIGVPDRMIPSLFTSFTQVSTGFSRLFDGAGLGLAICRRLVELMGGNIAMESEPGAGTTVAVSLPLVPLRHGVFGKGGDKGEGPSPGTGVRVLVAEDDYVDSYSVRVMLESAGFGVRTAENGTEALRLLAEHDFDVVLMDVRMPGMGGIETTEAIRNGEAGPGNATIPVVAMTAYAPPGDHERLIKSGITGFVPKPVGKTVLLSAMREALGGGADERPAVAPDVVSAEGPPGEDVWRPAPLAGAEPDTRFASAYRSPLDEIECDFLEISQNSCSVYFSFFPLPLLVLNNHRQLVFANQACLDMLGLSSVEDFLGHRPGEAIQCAYSGLEPGGCGTSRFCRECGLVRAVLGCMESNGPSTHDTRILQSVEGRCQAKDFRVHAVPFSVGEARFYVVTIQDISDLKQRELLERTFFHDIINTAGGARNLVELLQSEGDSELCELSGLLCTALNGLVDEIMSHRDLMMAERGDYPPHESRVMSGKLLEDVTRELLSQPLAEGRSIRISPSSEDHAVWADRSLLRRVLVNMLKNGLEATEVGGTVHAGCFSIDGRVVFEVRNDRVMEEKTQLQVFKRFYSTKGQGRGVGTYSIKLLTENYLGGKAEFVSNDSVGTVFRVSIPEMAD
ncbi:Sensory/regulatory protein RpfC [Pseudodesulfovibrio hydrargyri]|uniref:histidine kinase n=1 Tax=Pseudodesulfovibrio hydrargyri TaxID=2125990 RepID=A0A1J5MYF4_9BACT|nr:ATP-binding protein [Pseudodesulfovibrio hydrargyri]OIQ50868.1 Sensory/regulatory protein RpfC [Pseudodesulfovibrio hydrargyri]